MEARELIEGLGQGALQLERGVVAGELIGRLLRQAHTLKGAARVVKQPEVAELAHAMEEILAVVRDTAQPLSRTQSAELLRMLDEATAHVRALDPVEVVAVAETEARPAAPTEEPFDTLRVDMHEMDALVRGVTEATIQLGAVRTGLAEVSRMRELSGLLVDQLAAFGGTLAGHRARALADELRATLDRARRGLTVDVGRVDAELAEIREVAHRLRLVAVSTVFPSLERAVRDAAQAVGKRVDFETAGSETRLDAPVLAALRDALMHVVRNAVTHGIETPDQRVAAGKPRTGSVRLSIERRGARVAFVCRDDGRGIDVEAVRTAAIARGIVSAAEAKALDPARVIALLATGGLTTTRDVTELSGRGIGLDVARTTARRLKGELAIKSEPGRGATVELLVPVSIASLSGLIVEAGGALVAIPLEAVRETLRVPDSEISKSADHQSIVHDGAVIPFLPLDRALRRAPAAHHRRTWSAVVVASSNKRVAVGVDRLVGTSSIVMRSIPSIVDADPIVSGASFDDEGNPQLILDPSGLVAAAERGHGAGHDVAVVRPLPILVIDDSLTTRMLEQSILESAGYDVELAVSAEDGLAKARERKYSLFIVDVEMPGMDGFEFVTTTRADIALREIPAILVTSRNAPEDRRRGEQAGARAYIVKGEFDQGHLLKTIRALLA